MAGELTLWWLGLGAMLASWLLTALVMQYALKRQLLDHPNARSSHSQSTPRGGGLAFVLVVMTGLWLAPGPLTTDMIRLLLAGGITAAVGFLDDHRPLPALYRMVIYALAVALLLPVLSPVMLAFRFDLAPAFGPLLLVGVLMLGLWLVNLFNFMDGIDGLATVQTVSVCLAALLVYWFSPLEPDLTLMVLLGAALIGFLPWNWSPAKIFMGDIGSCFIGLMFAQLIITSLNQGLDYFIAWLILLAVFLTDATMTMLRRLYQGEKIWQAHRSHAYQHAASRWGHAPVSLIVGVINLLWLMPMAMLEVLDKIPSMLALVLAYLPLVALAWRLGAGVKHQPETD